VWAIRTRNKNRGGDPKIGVSRVLGYRGLVKRGGVQPATMSSVRDLVRGKR
jgi:hypothetical protein